MRTIGFTIWLEQNLTREMDIDAIEEAIFSIVGVAKIKRITTGEDTSAPTSPKPTIYEVMNED